jgi:hypothetical protein
VTVTDSVVVGVEGFAAGIGLSRTEEIPQPVPGMATTSFDAIRPDESVVTSTGVATVEELDPIVAVAAAVFEIAPRW